MRTPKQTRLEAPFTADKVKALRLGDRVTLKGGLIACRGDALQALSADGAWMGRRKDLGFFNAGPLVIGRDGSWSVCSAGPSVSSRSEAFLTTLITRYSVHLLLGQGGMGRDMCRVCAEQDCVYLQVIGLAGASLAKAVISVDHIHSGRPALDEDGPWSLDVDGIEAIVAIDASGKSLHQRVQRRAARNLVALLGETS